MRSLLKIFVAAIFTFSICSCGDNSENSDSDKDTYQDEDTQLIDNEVNDDKETTDEINDETVDDVNDELTDNNVNDEESSPDNDAEAGEYGFTFRIPVERTVDCDSSSMEPQLTQLDMDWLCTFEHNEKSGYVYLQHNTTSCEDFGMSVGGGFTNVGAWISIDGNVSTLTGGYYDWGGNHHNDSMGFEYNGKKYEYYHSSFGYGWRVCQNMDCINVNVGESDEELGCTSDRTLPIVCVQIKADGTHEELVDNFEKCAGDDS